ncbi:MAG: hypothetical protein ACXVCY_06380 [Pseudobdellovibrionaceae bacterium]
MNNIQHFLSVLLIALLMIPSFSEATVYDMKCVENKKSTASVVFAVSINVFHNDTGLSLTEKLSVIGGRAKCMNTEILYAGAGGKFEGIQQPANINILVSPNRKACSQMTDMQFDEKIKKQIAEIESQLGSQDGVDVYCPSDLN